MQLYNLSMVIFLYLLAPEHSQCNSAHSAFPIGLEIVCSLCVFHVPLVVYV